MKNLLIFFLLITVLAHGVALNAQSTDPAGCVFEGSLFSDSSQIIVGLPFVLYIRDNDALGCQLAVQYTTQTGNPFPAKPSIIIRLLDSYNDIIDQGGSALVPFKQNTIDFSVNRDWVESVYEGAGGRALIVLRDARTRFLTDESYATMRERFIVCPPVGGQDTFLIDAENGLYVANDTIVRMGGFLIEDTRIETNTFDFTMIDTITGAKYGFAYGSPIMGDTTAYFYKAKTFEDGRFYESYIGQGDGYSIIYGRDTVDENHTYINVTPSEIEMKSEAGAIGTDTLYGSFIFNKRGMFVTQVNNEEGGYSTALGLYKEMDTTRLIVKTRGVSLGLANAGDFLRLTNNITGESEFATIDLSGYLRYADNGLHIANDTIVRLGGTLLQNTQVESAGYTFDIGKISGTSKAYFQTFGGGPHYAGIYSTTGTVEATSTVGNGGWNFEIDGAGHLSQMVGTGTGFYALYLGSLGSTRFSMDSARFKIAGLPSYATHALATAGTQANQLYTITNGRSIYLNTGTGTNVSPNIWDNGTYVGVLNNKPFSLGQWTTAGQPAGTSGYMGWNTTLTGLDWYNGTRWATGLESTFARGTNTRVLYSDANGQTTDNANFLFDGRVRAPFGYSSASYGFVGDNTRYIEGRPNGLLLQGISGDAIYIAVGSGRLTPQTTLSTNLGAFNEVWNSLFIGTIRARLASGSATSPSYLFDDGTGNKVNAGMYATGTQTNNNLGFSTKATAEANATAKLWINADGKIAIGTNFTSPSYIFDINSTDALRIPRGTDAQRPTGAFGILRGNTTGTGLEWYNGTRWAYALESTFARGTATLVPFFDVNGQVTQDPDITWNSSLNNLIINSSGANGALTVNPSTAADGVLFTSSRAAWVSRRRTDEADFAALAVVAISGDFTSRLGIGLYTGAPYVGFGSGAAVRDVFIQRPVSTQALTINFTSSNTERFRFTNTASGFFTSSPTQELDVNGDAYIRDSTRLATTPAHTAITGLLTRDATGWIGLTTLSGLTYSGGVLSSTWMKPELEAGNNVKINSSNSITYKTGASIWTASSDQTATKISPSLIETYKTTTSNFGGLIRLRDTIDQDNTFAFQQDDRGFIQNFGTGRQLTMYADNISLPGQFRWFFGARVDTSVTTPTLRIMHGDRYASGTIPVEYSIYASVSNDASTANAAIRLNASGASGKKAFSLNSDIIAARIGGKVYFGSDSTFAFDPSTDLLQLSAYGTPATTAAALSKTLTNYGVGFATDGTVTSREIKRDTTIYVTDADYDFSAAITTAQINTRYNRIIIFMTCSSSASDHNTLTMHTPDSNLAQCEIVVYSIDDNPTYRNDITFGTSNLLSPTGSLNTTYNLSAGQWLHVRVADVSGYKYFISY